MSNLKMNPGRSAHVGADRRAYIGLAALAVASGALHAIGDAVAANPSPAPARPVDGGFRAGDVKQVKAGVLDIGYVELGPREGTAVILLHGWPYDIQSYAEVAPILAASRFRVLVPYLRGHGTTRFLSAATARNGQQYALAADLLAFMDAMGVKRAILAGYDWGGRIANVVAALHPDRCIGMVAGSGYLIGSQALGQIPLPPKSELQWWYQYYFATQRGEAGYAKNTHEFARLIWQLASPRWTFDDATFARSAAALDNPDHVAVTVHNYRWRFGLAEGDRAFDDMEAKLATFPAIAIPSISLEGDANGAPHPDPANYASKFTGRYEHRTLIGGIGHNPPQESPAAFAAAVMDVALR